MRTRRQLMSTSYLIVGAGLQLLVGAGFSETSLADRVLPNYGRTCRLTSAAN